jgi:tetratricopeptide (TPR) repeat protein
MKKRVVWFVLLIICGTALYSQTASQLQLLGDQSYASANYYSAIVYYEASLSLEGNNLPVMYQLAEAYRHLFSYSAAFSMYLDVWNKAPNEYPLAAFYAAMMLKSEQRYPEAKEMFEKYISGKPVKDENFSIQRANFEISACDSAMKMIDNQQNLNIRNFSEVNTPWSEFNPVALGDSLFVFSALKPLIVTENPLLASGEYRAQIYQAVYGSAGITSVQPMPQSINGKDQHSANIAFTADGNRAYFNRCSYANHKLRCDIWLSEKQNESWSKARKLPAPLNGNEYTSTQPYVAHDTVSGSDLLYFSSDREGGMGGLDLWFCIVKNGEPQTPINLGSIINTPGDEITPFYHTEEGVLYFSSDRHYGMGGFDVFKSKGGMSAWEKPKNMGYPINSGANDFFFFIASDIESFLSSNRKGSLTFRDQTCCNDIYVLKTPKPEIVVIVQVPDTIETTVKQDILELLPLSLYFDNDHPEPRTTTSVTSLTFTQTWVEYMKQRQKFIEEYSKGLDGFERFYAIAEMEDFFDNYVEGNYKKLEILSDLLYQDLKAGSNVVLKVRGFTSPLTSAEYNIMLGKRRISSLVNYFKWWNEGALVPYIDGFAENKATLSIIEESSGEALSNPYVSDNPHDRQKSVYSKSASMERRIQILIYESDFKKYVNIDENVPIILIPDNLVQLKDFSNIDDPMIEVLVSNPGKVPLRIFQIQPSSPRLIIVSYPKIIEPGESGVIKVRISGRPEQTFTEHLIIISDSGEERSVVHFSNLRKEN